MLINELPILARVIPPVEITAAELTSTTLADPGPGETAWTAGTYAAGDERTYLTRRYISLQAGNTKTPGAADAADWWTDVGPVNKWAMFDYYTNAASTGASPMVVEITPGQRITSVAVDGMVGNTLLIEYVQSGITQHSETIDLDTREVTDWTSHFFEEFTTKETVARFDIPPFSDGFLRVTLSSSDASDVSIGFLIVGKDVVLGSAERPSRVGAQNFSTVTRDAVTTQATMTPRRSVPKINARVFMDASNTNRTLRLKNTLNAVPAFYCLIDLDTHDFFEAMKMVGFYRVFDHDFSEPNYAYLDLETEAI